MMSLENVMALPGTPIPVLNVDGGLQVIVGGVRVILDPLGEPEWAIGRDNSAVNDTVYVAYRTDDGDSAQVHVASYFVNLSMSNAEVSDPFPIDVADGVMLTLAGATEL